MRARVIAKCSVAVVAVLCASSQGFGQNAAGGGGTGAAFEVASVKMSRADVPGSIRPSPGGTLTITNNTLLNMVRNAYGVQEYQIVGGPSWLKSERFDIVAKAAAPFAPSEAMGMLRTLLAERFALKTHVESRLMPAYALVMARDDRRPGPGLRPPAVDCAAMMAAARAGGPIPTPAPGGRPVCGLRMRPGQAAGSGVTMSQLASNLEGVLGRAVLDRTNLPGGWDFDLTFAADPGSALAADAPPANPDAPSVFTALREQLGLRVESQRAPLDVLVIDQAERPTPD